MTTSPQLSKSGSDTFKSKLKNLFDTLVVIEKDVNLPIETPNELEVDSPKWKYRVRKNRRTTRAMKGQESLFKVPALPSLRPRHIVPDFRRNPSRWTKYTLADVAADDMTDASNTAAALSFLNSRKERLGIEDFSDYNITLMKIVRKRRNNDISTCSDQSGFKDSKRVMPEYVVGVKVIKPKKIGQKPKKTGKELNLSHLHEFEEDE